jgi:calcineurin-like phosphoesterase family protein
MIIEYDHRPFRDVYEMNRKLVENWNSTVRPQDIVYYLGDISYGRNSRNADYWVEQLNGQIKFIKGNHDRGKMIRFYDHIYLGYKEFGFYLVHDPKKRLKLKNWDDENKWTICGHVHNSAIKKYPLINPEIRVVNVSMEMINYRPIDIDVIVDKIRQSKMQRLKDPGKGDK